MALKKLKFSEQRDRMYQNVINSLSNFNPLYAENLSSYISNNFKIGYFWNADLDKSIEQYYGETDDKENDDEWKLAKCLFMYSCTKKISVRSVSYGRVDNEQTSINEMGKKLLLENMKSLISNIFVEYEIHWDGTDDFIKYSLKDSKVVIENISNLDDDIAEPIKGLVSSMQSETELRGLIVEVYGKLEKIKKDSVRMTEIKSHLNNSEVGLFNDAIRLSGRLVNDLKENGKGHLGKTRLKLKTAAHNYALLVSLVYKIIELSDEEKEKTKNIEKK